MDDPQTVERRSRRPLLIGAILIVLGVIVISGAWIFTKFSWREAAAIPLFDSTNPREAAVKQQLDQISFAHFRESLAMTDEWKRSADRVFAPENFDYGTKPDAAELERRRTLFVSHRALSQKLIEFEEGAMQKLGREVHELGSGEQVVRFLDESKKSQKYKEVTLVPLWKTHVKTVDALVRMVEILERNPKAWTIENEMLTFLDTEVQAQFDAAQELAVEEGERLDELAARLRTSP